MGNDAHVWGMRPIIQAVGAPIRDRPSAFAYCIGERGAG
jgi:hypothetical protein